MVSRLRLAISARALGIGAGATPVFDRALSLILSQDDSVIALQDGDFLSAEQLFEINSRLLTQSLDVIQTQDGVTLVSNQEITPEELGIDFITTQAGDLLESQFGNALLVEQSDVPSEAEAIVDRLITENGDTFLTQDNANNVRINHNL